MTNRQTNTPAKGFRFSTTGPPPKTFGTLLYPYIGPRPPSASTEFLTSDSESPNMTAFKVTADGNTDYIFITETGPTQAHFADSNIQIEAEILLLRTSNGKPYSLAGKGVRKVVFFGETLFQQNEPAQDLYLNLNLKPRAGIYQNSPDRSRRYMMTGARALISPAQCFLQDRLIPDQPP